MNLAETNLLYRQPELYDHLNAGDTDRATLLLDLITAHAPHSATLLDLGCGTGRDLAHLATLAPRLRTTGVDVQPAMIEHGRRAHPHLDLRVGDLRALRLGHAVDVITCLGNTLAYLHTEPDLDAAFTTIAAHTRPGTLLIIQTLTGTPTAPPRTTTIQLPHATAEVTTCTDYDPVTQIATTTRQWTFPHGDRTTDHLRRRRITPAELRTRLTAAGFRIHAFETNPTAPTTYTVATAT